VVEQFGEKYTPEEIKRWYSLLDVAVQIPLAPAPLGQQNTSSKD
jgi:hypothetical protein